MTTDKTYIRELNWSRIYRCYELGSSYIVADFAEVPGDASAEH